MCCSTLNEQEHQSIGELKMGIYIMQCTTEEARHKYFFTVYREKISKRVVGGAPTNFFSGWLQYQPIVQSLSCNTSKCSLLCKQGVRVCE
jgi:hypothetical protein